VRYPKEIVLKGGTEAVLRPLEKSDATLLSRFYAELPEEDRWYLRYDVMDPVIIQKWIDGIDGGNVYSIIAVISDTIAAHGSLHMRGYGSTGHVGRFRIMVLPEFRYKRLGTWILLDLIQLSMDKGLRELRADFVVGVEEAAIEASYKFDFFKKAVLENYVKGLDGKRHDLLIMTKRLHKNWGDY